VKILVTGAAGFIGAHVARLLLERGHEVHALLFPGESRARIAAFEDQCTLYEGDLDQPRGIEKALARAKPEATVHLAWYAVPGKYWSSPKNLDCITQGMNLARILSEKGCKRIVVAGTCAEYDWDYEDLVEDETPCSPRTLYGTAKHALFLVLNKYCEQGPMELAWVRYNFLFGPSENKERLVRSVIEGLLAGRKVPCSEGLHERDFLHVEDAASATIAVLESRIRGAVNIGSGRPVAVRTVVEILADIIGGSGQPVFGSLPTDPDEPARLVPSVTRLNTEVEWNPLYSLKKRLEQTVESYRGLRPKTDSRRDH
jgi:nucleoside-diphosphate-sugar epimerase